MSLTILGIDPGLQRTGYAVLRYNGDGPELREAGVLTTNAGDAIEQRLKTIYDSIREIIAEFRPDALVVEKLYSHYNHPQTAVIMGHARGIVFLSAAHHKLPVIGYASTRIKKSVTGNGRATKMQVQRSVRSLLKLRDVPEPPDVADAIAVALCHIESLR